MTTELKLFKEAYATMTIAAYEPLVIRWLSKPALWHISNTYTMRAYKKGTRKTAMLVDKRYQSRSEHKGPSVENVLKGVGVDPTTIKLKGGLNEVINSLKDDAKKVIFRQFPNIAETQNVILPKGAMKVDGRTSQSTIPVIVSSGAVNSRIDLDVKATRQQVLNKLTDFMTDAVKMDPKPSSAQLRDQMFASLKGTLADGFRPGMDFLPMDGDWEEALSPIGIAHFYRQLYFNAKEGVGPVEEAFTVAPAETLEVVYETQRRQIHEEILEVGSETVSETAVESKNLDEVSDKVSSMIQRDSSAAMSASANVSASGGVGVWNVSAGATFGANATLSASSQRGTENVSRRLKEVTKRASERITKSFTIKTRDILEVTTSNATRRVISNPGPAPVSYGLRRVMRRVRVKVQSLGSRLVWQLYVRNPGDGIARSKFVHFLESEEISNPAVPPAMPPRPSGGIDTGVTSADLQLNSAPDRGYFVTIVVRGGSERQVTAVSIDSISDLEGGGKGDIAPSARNDIQWGQSYDSATGSFTVNIGVLPGDAASLQVNYTYVYEPGPTVLQAWEDQKATMMAAFEAEQAEARAAALQEKFDRERALITERSKIRPRPANDLRREERFEVMNRMISHLFSQSSQGAVPEPLEIELFHRYFEIDTMFVYTHPSWWKPRFAPAKTGLARRAYEITAESDPAPMGSSLGWMMQLDGDTRRNEFLNSPWVRVCLPMRIGREREAIAWLAEHIEGTIGYDPKSDPLKKLLSDVETARRREASLGIDGPDYVTVDSTVGAPDQALKPENVYPIIDEFEVTVPSDGFVYDELLVSVP